MQVPVTGFGETHGWPWEVSEEGHKHKMRS